MLLPSALSDWLRDLAGQRTRALSTVLGVAWGTFGVVGLFAFRAGLEELMAERAHGLGQGIVIAWPKATTIPFAGLPEGRPLRVTPAEVLALPAEIPELESACPELSRDETLQRGEAVYRARVSGVVPAYRALRSMQPEPGGRFVNQRDLDEERRVVFLGDKVKRQLFGDAEAVGRTLALQGVPFTVVGVLARKLQDSDYGGPDEVRVCIPITTYMRVFGGRFVANFVYRARSPGLVVQATDRVYEVLGRKHVFDPADRQVLYLWDTTENDRIRETAFLAMAVLTGGAGVLTLLVGGIGVGNLMFLLVRKRQREIGIQMALGARPRWILTDVLLTTLALVGVGGALGFLAVWGVAVAVGASPLVETLGAPTVSPVIGLGTVALLVAVGLAAGALPARRAARLDPVRALAEV